LETDNGVAYYGAPLTFRIGYNFKEKISVPQFVASFHNASAITAFTLNSDFQSNDIPSSLYGEGEVVCKIHFLPLLPGNYFVNVRLWQIGQKLDEIENVASFQVEWLKRDVGQFNWDSSTGVVYVDANWYLQ
jgi:hypothetical protein